MLKKLFVLVLSLIVVLVVSEVVLRVIDRPTSIEYGWKRTDDNNIHSKDDDYVVVLLGDSQVTNRGRKTAQRPGEILEEHLNNKFGTDCLTPKNKSRFNVITIGASGWGQDQQLLAMREYFELHSADFVVLWETPENDLWNNAFPTHYPLNGKPKPTFIIDGRGGLELVQKSKIIPFWIRSKIALLYYSTTRRISDFKPLIWDPDHWWDRHLPAASRVEKSAEDVDSISYLAKFNPFVERDSIDLEKTHFVLGINPGSERAEWMVKLTNLLLREIMELASNNGAGFLAFGYSASETDQPLYPPTGKYRIKNNSFEFSNAVAARRLENINHEINFQMLTLEEKKWRRRNLDPHLSPVANIEIMRKVSNLLHAEICPDILR